ncbi:MAG: hypothetical protein ABFD50_02770 [Smithella sp.]
MGLFGKKDKEEQSVDDPLQRFLQANVKNTFDVDRTGADAEAEVLDIEATDWEVHNQPVGMMKLKVKPKSGAGFETVAFATVDRIAVPRPGDKIKIKYNTADPTQVFINKEEIR